MFDRARRRLTLLYIALFGGVLVAFSAVFWVALSIVIQPAFDVEPELSNEAATRLAYEATVSRIAIAIVVADILAIAVVGVLAWVVAARTLRPIAEAHEGQRRFVADASHEIRTPLAAIRTTADGALLGANGVDELRRALAVIVRLDQRLSEMTDDLLTLARSEASDVPLSAETFDLSVLVAEVVESVRSANPLSADAITVDLGSDVMVHADRSEIARVIQNLLVNAMVHGAPPVRARVEIDESTAVVEVVDRGPGIPTAEHERIFEPFHRLGDNPAGRSGSGLGLTIARRLTTRNGGRLTVRSRSSSGTRFRLELRRSRSNEEAQGPRDRRVP